MEWIGFQIDYLLLLQNFRIWTDNSFNPIFLFITRFGEYPISITIIALFYWCINTKIGKLIFWNFAFNNYLNYLIKITACIDRPWIIDSRIQAVNNSHAPGYSFPSGHTAGVSSVFMPIAVSFWKNLLIKYLSFFIIFLVAFSRNYLGVHTLQDVIVSIILGIFIVFYSQKLLNWTNTNDKREFVVFLASVALSVILCLYTSYKNYPSGCNIAEFEFCSFYKSCFMILIFGGCYLNRKFIKFDASYGNLLYKIFKFVFGYGILYFLFAKGEYLIGKIINSDITFIINYSIIIAFITCLYPAFLKMLEKFFNKIFN